ncbi:MAG: hypothetical protein ACPG52_00530 [Cognaticolwellia sp.]
MSNRVEPEIPTITLDRDQTRKHSAKAKTAESSLSTTERKSSPMLRALLFLMPYAALAGAGWYFYQQQELANNALENSVERIQQLENQLSATGEEMGESTIALKVKLEAISEKTELLLSEMDKLWASAWRKNQSEIKALNSQSKKLVAQQSKNTAATTDLSDKVTATEFAIDAVAEQIVAVNSLKDEVKQLTSLLNTLNADAKSTKEQQMITATSINEFDTNLQLMLERIERIEARFIKSTLSGQP